VVFIRDKIVKGHSYAYIVKNSWDNENKKVKQVIIKYLGKSSLVTLNDIPKEYHQDPNVMAFLVRYSSDTQKTEKMECFMKEKMLDLLKNYDLQGLFEIFEKYSRNFGLGKFFERLLTPVMYTVGDLWGTGVLDVATEHICSNAAHTLVKLISQKASERVQSLSTKSKKILLCTPEGELHSLGCMVIESFLVSKGYATFNIAPPVPCDSVISFIKKLEPDIIIISVTLSENLRSARRLIDDILESNGKIPKIVVGGTGVSMIKKERYNDNVSGVRFSKSTSLSGLLTSIKESYNT
jgi:MerR family transcriptional regulator, light-induced transcriptional regulator